MKQHLTIEQLLDIKPEEIKILMEHPLIGTMWKEYEQLEKLVYVISIFKEKGAVAHILSDTAKQSNVGTLIGVLNEHYPRKAEKNNKASSIEEDETKWYVEVHESKQTYKFCEYELVDALWEVVKFLIIKPKKMESASSGTGKR